MNFYKKKYLSSFMLLSTLIYADIESSEYITTFKNQEISKIVVESPVQDSIPTIISNTDISNSWTSDEASEHRLGHYAKYYQFTLTEPQAVTIDLSSTMNINTYLILLSGDSQTSPIDDENHHGGEGRGNSRITKTLPAGTYVIEATTYSANTTGDFTLHMTIENIQSDMPSITFNTNESNNWTADTESKHRPGHYAKYYQFTLSEVQEVTIDLTSNIDTYLILLSGDTRTSPIDAKDDDGGEGYNSRITKTLPAGTYVIEATTYAANRTGDFTVTLTEGAYTPN